VGNTIQVSGITLGGAASCTVTYGSTASGGAGATAPSQVGALAFTSQERSTGTGTLTNLASSPQVSGPSADGSGTMTGSPNSLNVSSTGVTLVFTYTSSSGGLNGGKINVSVPGTWTAPSTTGTNAGFTTSTCGSVGIVGSAIQVTGVTLGGSATCTITYGSTGSSGPR